MFSPARQPKLFEHHVIHKVGPAGNRRQQSTSPRDRIEPGRAISRFLQFALDLPGAIVQLIEHRTPAKLRQIFIRMMDGAHELGAILRVNPKLCGC